MGGMVRFFMQKLVRVGLLKVNFGIKDVNFTELVALENGHIKKIDGVSIIFMS